MKAIVKTISITVVISALLTLTVSAQSGQGWYIVKRDGGSPGFPSDAGFLKEHSCYFIDQASADSGDKVLYLTFDAGYENGNVEKILDTLKAESVPAAFFILSNLIVKNTELVSRMFDEGHLVCNHTANHRSVPTLSREQTGENLSRLEDLCLEKTGRKMSRYFRYPEGVYSKESVLLLEELGYKTFFWSIAYADWDNAKQPSREHAKSALVRQTHPGAIVLLHPTSETNASILGEMIAEWRAMGYRFGTLDELADAT